MKTHEENGHLCSTGVAGVWGWRKEEVGGATGRKVMGPDHRGFK